MVTLKYITDFMRHVIENGSNFTENHFYILLLHLDVDQVWPTIADYLKVIVNQIKVPRKNFIRFLSGLKDHELLDAYQNII